MLRVNSTSTPSSQGRTCRINRVWLWFFRFDGGNQLSRVGIRSKVQLPLPCMSTTSDGSVYRRLFEISEYDKAYSEYSEYSSGLDAMYCSSYCSWPRLSMTTSVTLFTLHCVDIQYMSTMGHSVHTKCQTVVESSHFREKGIQAVIMVLPMSLSGLTLLSTVAAVSAEIHHHFYLSVQ